jgi:signal transduction histidine kinase
MRGSGEMDVETYKFIHKDGSIRWGEVKSILIEWEGAPATLNFITDMTERVNAEDQVKQEKGKSEFYLDLLGHDIGNLMQGISAWIEMARMQDKVPKELKMYLDQSWHLSERSKRLVKNVLIISRIRDREALLEDLEIVPIIRRSVAEVVNTFPTRDVEFRIIDNGLRPKIKAEKIVDEIFFNLVHNAIKFQTEGNARLEIVLEKSSENHDHVQISILDWGPGITKEQKEGIFRRFKDITGKKHTGIGLALTKELVDRYDGIIRVEDNIQEGKVAGAKIVLEFPCSL